MKLFTFKGGVHPSENKVQTENEAIQTFDAPKMVHVALLQHIGAPLNALVKPGDRVLKGQKIADSEAFMSAPVHSPVSGVVKKIEFLPFPLSGKVNTIIIENDGEEELAELKTIKDWKSAPKEDLLAMIREKGIVGVGGACFPTHIKLNPPKDVTIDTLVMNGAECEPYLNADNRLMLEDPKSIIEGIKIIMHILGVKNAKIGIENNKPEAIASMIKASEGDNGIEVCPLKTQYPQGGEKQLIKAILDREVPSGKLPSAVGVVVQNTATAALVYDGIVNGMPLIEKVVTISGKAIKKPMNLKVRIGTMFKDMLDYAGVEREEVDKLVMGGPMMGMAQHTEDVPVVKGTSGLLALTTAETNPCKAKNCILCGKCIGACPMGLEPLMYAKLAKFNQWEEMGKYKLMDCISCGSCAYICPSNRPLTEAINIGKAKLRTMARK
ncbi:MULTISPECIES: electron transport complex subunit RsxC [Psychrilyobacter]|uniref:Ion-translocating oxidoreductase complex subunit C n=1 Tax=Psychrilyobacter piezotolerans TaxID=2293438 RepID=A0ABX9KEG6_9FUSO|nr:MULTISPECIES: electron transport complex subunit RsxC [Psychrilyobacter]MCS5421933.1 electron transport complex subunit RsxC [Psychrilyobacter sp. S5]NDI78951.1 electron transport complex subunit RsxC [Psychrilyobacter piezotolerans]RDE59243.1 electron transport complex subunit RsxC [Psychrilyobacter sp. S5]REI39803.1 electron transport complex subunit RsxC [Psychrilyobacter piezotolerans]